MDAMSEESARSDVDAEMTMLTPEDVAEQNVDDSDEVEALQKSLLEVVHDDSVRPKMQCLMMDSSFSMVAMQGEDSGIAWETTPSRCSTPWTSEPRAMDFSSSVVVQPAAPGSHPAGKIIFEMDEEMISRQRKAKERAPSRANKMEKQEILVLSTENLSKRPELVEVSQPNVKTEDERGGAEEVSDRLEEKEQRLFRLVSEGSEILNIVVPPKMATVDEEESKVMVDNLSYLEEVPVPKLTEEIQDNEILVLGGLEIQMDQTVGSSQLMAQGAMDPPGAPVARPLGRPIVGNTDYFEAFALVDAQAPGGPAVITSGQQEPEATVTNENLDEETPRRTEVVDIRNERDKSDTVSLEEISGELLDEVFYAGTESYPKPSDSGDAATARSLSRLPSKPSGSTLFGSQEDILTPIFLPEGPPKIIDQILLEEPKAMAFLYTDLYEEALGCRKKEEDAESLTSEKSFHSRQSDREARGYLEKFVLIDETPVVETERSENQETPAEGEPRVLPKGVYDFEDFSTNGQQIEMEHSEEITDFFRASDNSSPVDIEPFSSRLGEDDATETKTKPKPKAQKIVSIVEKVPEASVDPLSLSTFEFPYEEPDWGAIEDPPMGADEVFKHGEMWKQEATAPEAPPRKKTPSAPKASLDLTPLTPVHLVQEDGEVGGKENREEEKEAASPAETASPAEPIDEGEGGSVGGESQEGSSEVALSEAVLAMLQTEDPESGDVKGPDEKTDIEMVEEEIKEVEGKSGTETAAEQTELKEEVAETAVEPEVRVDSSATQPPESAKPKGQCIIL